MTATTQSIPRSSPTRTGYLPVIGWIQILLGGFHTFFSVVGLIYFFALDPLNASRAEPSWQRLQAYGAGTALQLEGLVAAYLTLQILGGWVIGLLTIWAGVESRRARRRSFIKGVAIVNLFFFPLGTTVGSIVLVGIHRPDVKARFK